MVIVNISGGLGNQMFQYAYSKLLEENKREVLLCKRDLQCPSWNRLSPKNAQNKFYNENYHLHGYFLKDIFEIEADFADPHDLKKYSSNNIKNVLLSKLGCRTPKTISEKDFSAENLHGYAHTDVDNAFVVGYWQQLSLYEKISNTLRQSFTFKKTLSEKNQETAFKIATTNSVSIHVRRGDFLKHPQLYPCLDASYYADAAKIISSHTSDTNYFCFSDETEWCKKNLPFQNITYVDWNLGRDNYVDMQLMSLCKHNIIANSTFSAWAAWINSNPDKIVVCPSIFTYGSGDCEIHNFLPQSWIRLHIQ
ncbi:MAG: alpha-1,2-fucosyltransferase [Oscillospiraceae bacterium]